MELGTLTKWELTKFNYPIFPKKNIYIKWKKYGNALDGLKNNWNWNDTIMSKKTWHSLETKLQILPPKDAP